MSKMTKQQALAELTGPNSRQAIKRLFDVAEDKRNDPATILGALAQTCRERAALKRKLDDEERQWLQEMLTVCEDATRELKALIGPQMATEGETLRVRTESQRRRTRMRRNGLLPSGSGH